MSEEKPRTEQGSIVPYLIANKAMLDDAEVGVALDRLLDSKLYRIPRYRSALLRTASRFLEMLKSDVEWDGDTVEGEE